MEIVKITRVFNYNGIGLADPNPKLSSDEVRAFYAAQYPELNNAVIEGPTTKDNQAKYQFLRAVGDKGAVPANAEQRSRVTAIAQGDAIAGMARPHLSEFNMETSGIHVISGSLLRVATSTQVGRPLQMPSQAFGIWG